MNRAVIMSLEGSRAIVLAEGGRFLRVPRQPQYEVGDEIELEPEEAAPGRRRTIVRRRTFLVAAASCAAAVMLIASVWTFRTPPVVAYVTMDINPSLELGIDGKEKVRSLEALNADAEPIVESVSFKGKDVETVAAELAAELASRHLLSGPDSEVVLASVPMRDVSKQWEAEVTGKLKRAIEAAGTEPPTATAPADAAETGGADAPATGTGPAAAQGTPGAAGEASGQAGAGSPEAGEGERTAAAAGSHAAGSAPKVTTVSVPKEVREAARQNGVSAGKMAFWLKAESEGHDVALDTLKKESLKKIAASWGGVGQVLEGGGSGTSDGTSGDEWMRLLAQSLAQPATSEPKASGLAKSEPASVNPSGAAGRAGGRKAGSASAGPGGRKRAGAPLAKPPEIRLPSAKPPAIRLPSSGDGSPWRQVGVAGRSVSGDAGRSGLRAPGTAGGGLERWLIPSWAGKLPGSRIGPGRSQDEDKSPGAARAGYLPGNGGGAGGSLSRASGGKSGGDSSGRSRGTDEKGGKGDRQSRNPGAGANNAMDGRNGAGGGAKSAGGASAGGGAKSVGGANAGGGAKSVGGANAGGGAKWAGGANAGGGAKSAGGANAAGGAKSAGGASAGGGAKSAGGTNAGGARKNSGGDGGIRRGGVPSNGGGSGEAGGKSP